MSAPISLRGTNKVSSIANESSAYVMVAASGRVTTVRAALSAGIARSLICTTKLRSRKILSGYTHPSSVPASFPNKPAFGPTAQTNSHGRAGLEISTCGAGGASVCATAAAAGRIKTRLARTPPSFIRRQFLLRRGDAVRHWLQSFRILSRIVANSSTQLNHAIGP